MDVKLPSLGEGADSGVVVSVLVKEGDAIDEGQTILEIENEKAVAPIPASASGRIRQIHVKAGDRISVGALLLTLGDATAMAPPSTLSAPTPPTSMAPPQAPAPAPLAPAPVLHATPPPASPGVRKLAADLGLDLRRVRGSQPGGRIIMEDLRAYVQWLVQTAHGAPSAAPGLAAPTPTTASIDFAQWGRVNKRPFTPLRKVISRRMSESWHAVPRVTQFEEVDITALMELRKQHLDSYKARGANLTLTCFVLRAVVTTLKTHPIFNASLDETSQELVLKEYYHIGIAVDTEAGLLVPVLRDVDRKSVLDLARELGSLGERARDRKITADEMKGGTFTLSNQGAIGGGHFTPIVNLPEVAILGLGRSALKPAVVQGNIQPRWILPLALSYDHRIIDGAAAARFTVDLVQNLIDFPEAAVRL